MRKIMAAYKQGNMVEVIIKDNDKNYYSVWFPVPKEWEIYDDFKAYACKPIYKGMFYLLNVRDFFHEYQES